jgi:hypothetical protein
MTEGKTKMLNESKEAPKSPTKNTLSKPAEFQEFVVWMSTPENLRELKTQKELAAKIGVHEDTLTDWKQRDDFWEAVEKEWNKWGREKTSNVIKTFYNRLLSKNATTADFKLWFQFFLNWNEKTEVQHTVDIHEIKELLVIVRQIPEGAFIEYFNKQRSDGQVDGATTSPAGKDTPIR